MYNNPSYKISFVLAIALHIVLAIMLCIKISSMEKQPVMQSNTSIIKAFSVSQNVVEKKLTATTAAQPTQIQQQQPTTPTITQPPSQQQKQPEQNKNIEQQKEAKLQQQRTLEKTLKQQMLAAQNEEAKTLKKELQVKNKELTAVQKSQEKQILHNAFADELKKEDKQLQKNGKQLNQLEISGSTPTNTNNSANNAQTQGEIDKYKALIIQAIAQEWIVPDDVDKNTSCKLLVNLGPGGVVLRVQILQPSNNSLLDRSAQNAVWKASPLPVPKDNNLLDNFRSIQLTVRPEEISS